MQEQGNIRGDVYYVTYVTTVSLCKVLQLQVIITKFIRIITFLIPNDCCTEL